MGLFTNFFHSLLAFMWQQWVALFILAWFLCIGLCFRARYSERERRFWIMLPAALTAIGIVFSGLCLGPIYASIYENPLSGEKPAYCEHLSARDCQDQVDVRLNYSRLAITEDGRVLPLHTWANVFGGSVVLAYLAAVPLGVLACTLKKQLRPLIA